MKFSNYYKLMQTCLLLCCAFTPSAVLAAEADELRTLLHEFLAAADQEAAHRRFWADDLVYTSSNGTRTDKPGILASLVDASSSHEPSVVYFGEDVDIRVYDSAAIIAFRLVGTPGDRSEPQHYFNTGTFLKRDGGWQAVAWQATRIPSAEPVGD